jgi:hypothetical protein
MHERELRQNINSMPFIYAGLELDVLQDFVEFDVSSTNVLDPFRQTAKQFDGRSMRARLEATRRAVLFGAGGYGKTTFFRHTILAVIDGAPSAAFKGRGRPVPIYVPIKAIDPTSRFPILNYVRTRCSYFGGRLGLLRLIRLAERGKLALFVDGYDEMPYTGGQDFVKAELSALFSAPFEHLPFQDIDDETKKFYEAIRRNRIYLSSRQDFFVTRPLKLSGDVPHWLIAGIGERRITLVQRIFERYKKTERSWAADGLNAELFMQELSAARNDVLSELSRSPLFLTVMCYVYASAIRGGEEGGKVFASRVSDLVISCVQLLLRDIDKEKTRGMPDSERRALMNRRSSYPDQKFNFLRFVAATSYKEKRSVFGQGWLESKATEFFSSIKEPDPGATIAQGVGCGDPAADPLLQLRYCGILILVDRRGGEEQFDFPHRRFRETLAVQSMDNEEGVRFVAERIQDQEFSELALVFIEQSKRYRHVIELMANAARKEPQREERSRFLAQGLKRVPDRSYASQVTYELLRDLSDATSRVQLSRSLIPLLSVDPADIREYLHKFSTYARNGNRVGTSIWLEVCNSTCKEQLGVLLEETLSNARLVRSIAIHVLALSPTVSMPLLECSLRTYLREHSNGLAVGQILADVMKHTFLGRHRDIQEQVRRTLGKELAEVDPDLAAAAASGGDLWIAALHTFVGRPCSPEIVSLAQTRFGGLKGMDIESVWLAS